MNSRNAKSLTSLLLVLILAASTSYGAAATGNPEESNISESSSPEQDREQRLIWMERDLDLTSVYVQQQAILRVRIYHAIPLYDNSQLSPLRLDHAEVESLGSAIASETLINGQRYGVIETRYSIFPQESGVLSIKAQSFTGTTPDSATNSLKRIHLNSSDLKLSVRPKPTDYPAQAPWLPARQLTLEEEWSPTQEAQALGTAFSHRVRLQAQGLTAAQLPSLEPPEQAGIRYYPDQPRLTNHPTEQGVLGSREMRALLIPSKAGSFSSPATELIWWNTLEDRLERIQIPSRQWTIRDTSPAAQPLSPTPSPRIITQPQWVGFAEGVPIWIWQLSTLVFACTSILGFWLWWKARHQPAVIARAPSNEAPKQLLSEALHLACLRNDPQGSRQALDAWARQQPETLADMAARFSPLSDALNALNGALYSEAGQHWQGEALWEAINHLPPKPQEGQEQTQSTLPPLYPQ